MSRLLLALVIVAGVALGQAPVTGQGAADTTGAAAAGDTTRILFPIPHKSPGTAVLLSFLLPGGGQVYTGQYWHAAVIAPAEVTLGYFSVRDHQGATRALAGGDTARYVQLRDRRNALLWWTGAVLAFSMADAYVSAQLFGFDRQMRFALGPTKIGLELDM